MGVSRGRILRAALVVAVTLWVLNWIRAEAAISLQELPVDQELGDAEVAPRGMDELVSLDLRSTEATEALKYLAVKGELNIAISKNVSGRVNLYLADVPIRDVFDLILRSNELAYEMQGGVYNIMTEAEYQALYGKKFSDLREVRTFRLQYAIPQQAFSLLDTLKSDIGRLLIDEDSGTVLMMDTAENLLVIEDALAVLEQGGLTHIVDLNYAVAIDIEAQLNERLEVDKLGYVKADERTNQLLIKAYPERMKELKSLIASLDRKTRAVLIDSKIIKVDLTDRMDSGIDWDEVFRNLKFHGLDRAGDFRIATTGTAPSEVPNVTRFDLNGVLSGLIPGNRNPNVGNLLFGTIARDGYELFRYLQTVGDTKLISNPRILVTENHEAKIHVGTREAYVTTTTTTGQSTSTTAEEVEFIDVGIQLKVTPRITGDGYILMKIAPEISSVVRTLQTPAGADIPIVDTSTIETEVLVEDGGTIVLGGLRKNEKKFNNEQVPYLGHIPFLGPLLFRKTDRDNTLTEMVIFITPHIVQGDTMVTGRELRKLRSYRDYGPILSQEPSGLRK